MTTFKRLLSSVFPVFPFLLGLYPVMYLWSINRAQQPYYVLFPALLITLAALGLVYLVALVVFRSSHRAALLTAILSLYVLSYGHILNLAVQWIPNLQPDTFLLVTGIILIASLAFIILRRAGSRRLTVVLNLVSAFLILYQLVVAVPYYIADSIYNQTATASATHEKKASLTVSGTARDIYFIILDNYGRRDVLLNRDHFDNTELINALKERGFIFPDCAQGNYPATAPVIASILNMDYLDKEGIQDATYANRAGYPKIAPYIKDNEVMRKFREYGYQIVTFRGYMGMIDIQNSDTYINFESDTEYAARLETRKFQDLYFQTTLVSEMNKKLKIYPELITSRAPEFIKKLLPKDNGIAMKYMQVYEQNLYSFDALQSIPLDVKSPKFVYAHIYAAHWPFMMNPDGSLRLPFSEEMTTAGYLDGLRYTNSRILGVIDSIIQNSSVPPVIILQGDHSNGWIAPVEWSGTNRLKILSAYYLPDGGDQLLYSEISPVNNFRLVFKKYFGEPLDLLPDTWHYLDAKSKTIQDAPKTCISTEMQQQSQEPWFQRTQ